MKNIGLNAEIARADRRTPYAAVLGCGWKQSRAFQDSSDTLTRCGLSDPRLKTFWASRNRPQGFFADARKRLMRYRQRKTPAVSCRGFA
jgi:hypothetical protein